MYEEDQEVAQESEAGDYKCPICSHLMSSQKDFTSHLRGHNEVKPSPDPSDPTGQAKVYNCCLCGKMLSSFSSLDRHMLVHSGERPFSCAFCGQTFTTNGNMHRHQRTHGLKAPGDGEMEGKLPSCGLIQGRKRPLNGGSGNSSGDDTYSGTNNNSNIKEIFSSSAIKCPVCKETFINDISVETHLLASHPGQQLRCEVCPAMYPTFQNLKLHKYLHHLSSMPTTSYPSNSPFSAAMLMSSPDKSPLSPLKIPFHVSPEVSPEDRERERERSRSPQLTSTPVKSQLEGALTRPLHKDKDLADIPSIITMAQNFTGIPKNENSPVKSSVLEQEISTYEDDDDLSSPKKIRLEEDPPFDDDPVIKEMKLKGEFPCSLCPAVFPNLRALKGHNKEHLGKAPYRCNVGTCTYSSNDKSTLTRHMRRHTGEKPFECKLCSFGFTTKANCERHLKNKHQKLTRDQIRESLIIHETEDTETMISRMQMSGDVTVGNQDRHSRHPQRLEVDTAFRCKVCKLTFMSKFAAIQHGIHNHPEYAENIDEIAEQVGLNGAMKSDLSPDIIEIVQPGRNKLKSLSNFYPNNGEAEAGGNDITEEAPLDLSQSSPAEDGGSLLERKISTEAAEEKKDVKSSCPPGPLPPPMFPPGLPYFMPGLPNQNPFAFFYPQLMMPQLFGQSLDKESQEKMQKDLMQRLQLQSRGSFPGASLPLGPMDLASMMAAQAEAVRKQTEIKQQQEAAETLQKLSQMQVLPSQGKGSAASEDGTNSDSNNKAKDETQYKMVMKNGVLMKKQKQRRYRTERPYSCQSCTARFTLRSNMERHIKQQHPETWGDKLKGSRRHYGNMSVPQISPELKDQYQDTLVEAEAEAEKENENEEEEGELIIDDQPEDVEEDRDRPPADLASITNLLNTANNQSFNQYFTSGSQDEDSSHVKEDNESNSDTDCKEEKKSAYSSAPHKISCPFCSRKFPWESSLKRHILTHTGQKPFKCRDCPLWFTTKSNCDRHQIRKHGEASLEAAYLARNVPDRPYKCSLCPSSTFSSEENLKLHQCTKHLNLDIREENMENDEDDGEENAGVVSSYFKCHLCDEDFITRDHVIAHIEHEHQDAYNEDKDVYETASKMNTEYKRPNGADGKEDEMCRRVNCIFCPCQFVSTNELRKHVLLHVNNKPFACDICNKKFTIKQALMRHKKKHDSGVSSDDENSEEDSLPHYRIGLSSQIKHLSPEPSQTEAGLGAVPLVAKRANLMDTINKLSAARAENLDKKSTLDQLFGNPSIAQT